MQVLPPRRRILLLTEGSLGIFSSKTAACLLRYRAADVVGIIDSAAAGEDIRTRIPWAQQIPILANIAAAQSLKPDSLFVGVAPVGGVLPTPMRAHVVAAIGAGLDVVSGLHMRLQADPEFSTLASERGVRIHDVRAPLGPDRVARLQALETRCVRVLTIGTDCNVGKMVTAVETTLALQKRGIKAAFAATGQTGIMIAGRGIAIDAVVSDFAAGAAEELVLSAADADFCIVEGQGSVVHPGFSGVTLALLHGVCPDAMILVHHLGRTRYAAEPHTPLPDIGRLRDHYEQAASFLHPSKVVAVAVNAHGADPMAALSERRRIEATLDLPIVDPVNEGAERIAEILLQLPACKRLTRKT